MSTAKKDQPTETEIGHVEGSVEMVHGATNDQLRDAMDELRDTFVNPYAVAQLPLTMRLGFRFKLLMLCTLNAFGMLFVAIAFVGPLNKYVEKDRVSWNLLSLLSYLLSMGVMAQSKVRFDLPLIRRTRVAKPKSLSSRAGLAPSPLRF